MEHTPYNELSLCGTLNVSPTFSHESHGIRYFSFPLCIKRLSGAVDTINIIANETLLPDVKVGDFLLVHGEIRSFNNNSGIGNKLSVFAFAKKLSICQCEYQNDLNLGGVVCKTPIYRRTPFGREICDLMIAINRKYGRSDYLPCIAWGRIASSASILATGDFVHITGRFQSRTYVKALDDHEETRTAYEVSVFTLET